MTTTRLAWRTSSLVALALWAACGGSDSSPGATVIDKATVSGGSEPVVVTLAAKRARTEFELPASTTRERVALQIEENVPGTGDVFPANGMVLHVTTPGLTFDPPASMRQSVVPPTLNQRYVAIRMPSAGATWVVGLSARRGSFHDPQQPTSTTSGTEVWEIDVTDSGLWALALVPDARLDGGLPDADDRGMVREVGDPLVSDGGGPRGQLDGAVSRWDAGARAEVSTEVLTVDAPADDTVPEVRAIAPDARASIDDLDVPAAAQPDVGVALRDGRGAMDAFYSTTGDGLLASPRSVDFGSVTVGGESTAIAVTVTNPLSSAASVSAQVTGSAFSIADRSCTEMLASGASCTISVKFSPTQTGAFTGSLSVGPALGIALSGNGTDVLLTLTTPSVPPTAVGATADSSVPISFTGPLTGLACAASDPAFTVSLGSCSPSYGAAGSCTLALTFAPTSAGTAKGSLSCTAVGASAATLSIVGTAIESPLTVSPTSLDFGSVVTGAASAATSLSIHNGGTVATGALSLALGGASAAWFSFTSTCASGLVAGATCVVMVTFKPQAAGSAAATLTVNDGSATCTVPLSGTGTAAQPQLTALPSAVTFGTLLVNTASVPASITLRNGGATTTGVLGFAITGPAASSFSLNDACPSPLTTGDACEMTVTFKPTTTGSFTATLTVSDGNLIATVPLSGAGAGASALQITVSPEALDFGSVVTGATSAPTSVSIRNSGTATTSTIALNLAGAAASSFAVVSGCASPLAPGETCTAAVTFRPAAAGSATAMLTVTDGNAIATVSLTGVGAGATSPRLTISPDSIDFGAIAVGTTSAATVFSIANSGGATTGSLVFSIAGASASSFAARSTCSSPLAPGSLCTIAVTFAPTAVRSATATLTVADGTATASAALSGNGIAPARLVASPTSVSFSGAVVGSTSSPTGITVTNAGSTATGSLTVTRSGAAAASFTTATTTCSGALAPGASCLVAMVFAPVTTGALSATVTIGDGSSSVAVALTGAAVTAARLTASPTRLDLGSIVLGATSAAQTIIITNGGNVATGSLSATLTGASAASFAMVATTCIGPLSPASSCTVAVQFTPLAVGAAAATLTVSDGTATATANLTATGVSATPAAATP